MIVAKWWDMAPMPSPEYSPEVRSELLAIARASLVHGVRTGVPLPLDPEKLSGQLAETRAVFVTLRRHGQLRGCTGSLEARLPLAVEVARTACATALSDPRFPPVSAAEIHDISIEISVLSPLTPFPVRDEADLLARLVPGVDGLVLEAGPYQATFLPKVWEDLPSPRDFVAELKAKAGLPRNFWSPDIAFHRYHTETFAEPPP